MPHAVHTSAAPPQVGVVPDRRRSGLRIVALGALIVVVSLVWGGATASADGTFGPHLARYAVTLDGQATIDLGPLGTLVIDSPVPVLGARVTVKEIPSTLSAVDLATTLDNLGTDLRRYLELFSAPDVTLRAAVHDLVVDAVRRAVLAAALLTAALVGGRRLLGPTRRVELAAVWARHSGRVTAVVVVVLLLAGTVTASAPRVPTDSRLREASSVFDGTPLAGARITGRLAGLVDTYGGYAVKAYRENEAFYDGAVTAVDAAWRNRVASESRVESRSATAGSSPSAVTENSPIVAVVVSDLHCNVGMAKVLRTVAKLASADLVLNAGDSTLDGTAVESYCVDTFASAVPSGVPYVISDGNHDSSETSSQERAVGAQVLDGTVIEVDGLRILGDRDPHATRVGSGTSKVGDETFADAGHRLADVACEDGDVDLLLVHTPDVGTEALRRGCVPSQVSGHWHRRVDPKRIGAGVRYISSSTSGALVNEPTVGPLHGTAELTILRFDRETHAIVDYRLVQVHVDGTASVGVAVRWPVTPITPTVVPLRGDPV